LVSITDLAQPVHVVKKDIVIMKDLKQKTVMDNEAARILDSRIKGATSSSSHEGILAFCYMLRQ
jgi:hypothetical protein